MQQSQRGGKTSKQPKTGAKPTESKSGNEDQAEDACSKDTSQNAIIEQISLLSKEWKRDFTVFKNEVLQTMKDDLAEFKDEVLNELQTQNANITSAQTRIAELESTCVALRDTLLTTIQLNIDTQDKMVDLESRSRRNNLRIYGVPEGQEGKSVIEFVTQLLTEQLELPPGVDVQIQRAHRALTTKPPPEQPPRSLVVNFLQHRVKEMILQKAWSKKIELDGGRIYFDHDYASAVVDKRKEYGPIKTVLKENGIRFQTPYTKMHVHWQSGKQTYESAEEAAADLNRRGLQVSVKTKTRNQMAIAERRLMELLPWTEVSSTAGRTAQRARERLTEFRRNTETT